MSQYSVQTEQLRWFADCVFVLCVSCRNPSSPRQTCGPGGQQLGGDGPLAAAGFIRSLCCQQLHCGVQTGRYMWKQPDYYFKCAVTKLETKPFFSSLRLVAVAAGGRQQRGVRSDRRSDPRRSLPVQSASLQPLGGRPAIRALKHGHAAQH